MSVFIEKGDDALYVKINHPRIDGENLILKALENDGRLEDPDYSVLELDLASVEYLNSLGITEFVNIRRRFRNGPRDVSMRLINVDKRVQAILELVEIQKIAEIVPRTY